jgi:predicted glycoside hydrolase/deacetylase ChbG (UPF0249 family)
MSEKTVVVCADDYGLSPGVGAAIRALIELRRLSATSCMTGCRFWPAEAEALRPLRPQADIGLHLTLTDHAPIGPMPDLAPEGRLPPLGRLMGLAFLGRLDRGEILAEFERQLDAFEAAMGGPPDHVDGHHHVHQLPVVREALALLYEKRLRRHGTYVRYCDEPLGAIARSGVAVTRAAVISLLGRSWARTGRARAIPGNRGFRGVRGFDEASFAVLFRRYLAGAGDNSMIMCHPGFADADLAAVEHVTAQREDEYRYLASSACAEDLVAAGMRIARFRRDAP